MIERIKALLLDGGGEGSPGGEIVREDDARVAAAALLVEAACTDGTVDDSERHTIAQLLRSSFGLEAEDAVELIEIATRAVKESNQLYAFTRIINDRYSHEERVGIIEMLWEVAYADGHLHHYESNLVRRVSGLIHVPDRESGEAHKRVLARVDLAVAASS
jgi:uncharacterized tellurite resistance protein B-like protein